MDGAQQVEVRDVQVVAATYFTLRCIIGGRFVGVPSLKTLPGTDVARRGDRGRLVLPRDVAERLGLAEVHRHRHGALARVHRRSREL